MNRRAFISLLALVAGSGSAGFYAYTMKGPGSRTKEFQELILPLGRLPSTGALALAYFKHYPEEEGVDLLANQLLKDIHPDLAFFTKKEQFAAALQRQVQKEYDADKLVELDGWFLSRTEARLLALSYVLAKRA